MTRRLAPTTFGMAALAASLMLLPACNDSTRYYETTTLQLPYSGGGIEVSTSNGRISVERADRTDTEIVARLGARTRARLEDMSVRAERNADGDLVIEPIWPGGRRQRGDAAAFSISTPDANGLVLHSSNGKVEAFGLSGPADLVSSNGAIVVKDHDGPVEADTSNGRIRISGVHGDVYADTSNGSIVVEDAPSAVFASTSNGSVDVEFRPEATGPVNVETSNGGVTVVLPAELSGRLVVRTSNGSLDVDDLAGARLVRLSRNRVELELGGATQTRSEIRTSNGNVRVRKPRTVSSDDSL